MLRVTAAVTMLTATIAATPGGLTTASGVYTESQAVSGARTYAERCAMCHGGALEGTYETPGLTGKFVANWSSAPLSDLYDYIGRAMPQPAPGTLTPGETAEVVAYLLKANGMPAGARPLAADNAALRQIAFVPVRAR